MVKSRLGLMLRGKGTLADNEEATGIHRNLLSRYATGAAMPKLPHGLTLAEYLNITPQELLTLCYEAQEQRHIRLTLREVQEQQSAAARERRAV